MPTSDLNHHDQSVLVIAVCFCAIVATVRIAGLRRLPPATLYFDIGAAIALVSVFALLGPREHTDFAVLFLWVALYAALYFRPAHTFVVLGIEGLAYAMVLTFGPSVDNPVTAWILIMATGFVLDGAVVTLVSELKRLSREDPLTKLPNRRTWDERIEEELERARRGGTSLSVVIFDIDRFKAINDQMGHLEGDRVLVQLANCWRETLRSGGDFVARIGGDEFGILAPGNTESGVRSLIGRLETASPNGVTCSFGAATWDGDESGASLFRRADEAMYQTKRTKTPPR